MARNDLYYLYPDILFVALHGPDGEEYGGILERERPLLGDYSFIRDPVLQASYSDDMFRVSFEKSYAQGQEPNWHVHIEGDDIDEEDHKILMDLQFYAPSSPLWIHSNRPIQNSKANIASYVFIGCDVTGTVEIDGFSYNVEGVGHHEHSWASGVITKTLIRGWDWCHMKMDNGWNIYYSNYYFLPQVKLTKETKINPLSTLLVTTDQGEKITILDDMEISILQSDKIFPFLNIPVDTQISATSSTTQILMKTFKIHLDLNIKAENTLDHKWQRLAYVGMKIGRSIVSGTITWTDNNGDHNVELNGITTIWNMRS
jgi:predicted secreted hydrolase